MAFASVILFILSISVLIGRSDKYFELASHFLFQYFLASVGCFLICLYVADWLFAGVALMSAAINLSSIAPVYRKRRGAVSVGEKRRLKLALANVDKLNRRHEKLLQWIERNHPDVVVVQEVTEDWAQALKALHPRYSFSEVAPRAEGSGMAIYSRLPFDRTAVRFSEGEDRPSLMIRLIIDGAKVSILSIHPRAPIRRGHFELRNQMLDEAAACLKALPGSKICVGDLNTSIWSPFYRRFIIQTKLINVRLGIGLLPSWPTYLRFSWLMIPLDHCLVSHDIRVIHAQTGERIGSDHLPLFVELEI